MAFDSAMHYLDELKEKYMHEVEKAIDDWDYQDFSPDKRTPLLENEISADAAMDCNPEPNALQQIKEAGNRDWSGLSRDEMIANQTFGRMSITATSAISFEARVVAMATPGGGVQGLPDADVIQRFLHHAARMNPQALSEAFCQRLEQSTWQIRAKALVLMEMILESRDLLGTHLAAFRANVTLLQRIDQIRTQDHSTITRENARRVLSLIRSNGTDAMLVAREHSPTKPHVRHSPTAKKKTAVVKPLSRLSVQTKVPTPTIIKSSAPGAYQPSSPKIAAAAMASARRRSQIMQGTAPEKPVVKTLTPSPAPLFSKRMDSAIQLEKMGSTRSAFAFVDKPSTQPRVSITASRTQSFH